MIRTPRPIRQRRGPSPRLGITILEVFISLSILVGALAVIAQILRTGSRASTQAELQSEAVLRAETRLAEVVAGVYPLQTVSQQPFEDSASWTWSLDVADGPHPDLLRLMVTVEHLRATTGNNMQVSLSRLMRDPQLYLDAAAASEAESSGLELLQ